MWLLTALVAQAQNVPPQQVTERTARFDTALVSTGFDQPLKLLGTATWKERFLPLFMAGLYVPQGQTVDSVVDELTPKRLELVWRNKLLAADRIGQWWARKLKEGFVDPENLQRNQARIDQYVSVLGKQPANQRWVFEYQPDTGTILYVGGKKALHFVGSDINRALWNIWLGTGANGGFRNAITGRTGL